MEESVSGFKVTGDWGEVVEHGERLTRALREADAAEAHAEALEAWDDWRPKSHELLDAEIREKTAVHASVQEGAGERAGASPDEDIQSAGKKIAESYEKLGENEPDEAVEKWHDSIGFVARAADSAGRKALRSVEGTVYRRLMTQVAPYYFDNELVSANLSRSRNGADPFVFEVNVNDDALKAAVAERLDAFDQEIDRWHVSSEKETETAEAAEGVSAPETDPNADSRTT